MVLGPVIRSTRMDVRECAKVSSKCLLEIWVAHRISDYVRNNPLAFSDAYFELLWVKVYQH